MNCFLGSVRLVESKAGADDCEGQKRSRRPRASSSQGVNRKHTVQMKRTYVTFGPRNDLVNLRVIFVTSHGRAVGLSGSRIRRTSRSRNRICRIDDGRDPAGATRRRKRTARIRCSPSLNDLSVVLRVVLIWSFRSSVDIGRLTRGLWFSPLLSLAIACRPHTLEVVQTTA